MGLQKDKLDEMNRKTQIHSNIIKWWDVNMLPSIEEKDESDSSDNNSEIVEGKDNYPYTGMLYLDDIDDDASREIASMVLEKNNNQDAFNKAYFSMELEEYDNKKDEANEIYERLMREAAEDEAKKQKEIEEAKIMADQNFS